MDLNLADISFWQQSEAKRHEAFTYLRSLDKPIFINEGSLSRSGKQKGYYAFVKYDDVVEISKNSKVFSSEPGVTTPLPNKLASFVFGDSMVNMDNPRHGRLRNIVQRAFSPKNMEVVENDIQRVVTKAVDDMIANKPDDFVTSTGAQVPFNVVANMMGIPGKHRPMILKRINQTTERAGAEHALKKVHLPGRGTLAMAELHLLVMKIARDFRRNPDDSIMSALSNTEIDGKHLTARELGSFFNLLVVAGIETTRNALVHGLHLLTINPEQRELLMSDFEKYIPTAVDEIVRYEPSIVQFRRHVKTDYEIRGIKLRRGDMVAIFFLSANRDEEVFDDPNKFDITRDPNPHLGFGAGGPHICLGKLVARREMIAFYRELFTRLPNIRATGDFEWLPSTFDNRLRKLEFTW